MAYIPSKCSISDYEQVVYNGETKNKLYISFGGNELIDADHYCEKLTIKSRLLKNGNNYFSLDNFVSKEATLILHKVEIGKIKDPVIIELGTYIDKVQDYVYVPFGVFNIQGTPTNDKDKTTITLRDNSVNFDFDYNAKNEIDRNCGSATLYQILQDICKQAKVNCTVPSTLTGIDDKTGLYDNSIKARTYVSYIAEHCGKIATIDRNGYLIFVDLIGDAINLSGNNISIDNAIERPIETIQIDGKSTQETRSGKNIFNKNAIGISNGVNKSVLSTGIRTTITVAGQYKYFATKLGGSELLGKTLTFGGTISPSSQNQGSIALYYGSSSSAASSFIARISATGSRTLTLDTEFPSGTDSVYILFYGNNTGTGNVNDYVDYTDFMVVEGSTLENYEDYGVSPSPDYPSEVECVKGKNLFDGIFELGIINGTTGQNETNNNYIRNKNYIPVEELTDYKFSSIDFIGSVNIYEYKADFSYNLTTNKQISLLNYFTTNKDTKYIRFRPAGANTNLNLRFQLEKGTVATSYLPYNTIQVKNTKVNIFDSENWYETFHNINPNDMLKTTIDGIEYYKFRPNTIWNIPYMKGQFKENTQYIFSAKARQFDNVQYFSTGIVFVYTDGTSTRLLINKTLEEYTYYLTSAPNKTIDYIRLDYAVNNYVLMRNIQLQEGTKSTNYTPYQESITNIDLQGNELCSLPNGVKDELIIENGRAKIIKRVGKYNITGNEAWALSSTESQPYINFSNYVNDCKYPATTTELPNLLSNYYLQITRNNLYDGRITLSPGKALIIYDTVHNTSLANFKTWLKSASVVVYYELATPTEIDLGEAETLSTFKGVNNVSLDANMQTNMTLQYYKPKRAYTIPLNIVQSYEDGEDFKLSQVTYESGELYWNKGDNKNDTLYINSANPYITNQKNIDNIYNIVNGLEINSLKLKKQRGNPLLDCYDFIEIQTNNSNGLAKSGLFKSGIMKSMSSNAITYKTLAQNELTYNGKIMQTFDTTITKQAKTTNVSKNNEASLKKYVKSEIDGVKGELTTVVGKVDTIDVKTNNNYLEILNVFDEYTPQSDFLELENNVTRIQKDTYTKTEINQKLTNGSVTKVLTTAGTFDNNGLTIEKTNAKTKGNFNEKGMTIKDATGSTDTELLFVGYDDILNETIVRTKNIKVEKYLTIGKNSRIEDYNNGTGVFHIGE